MRSYMNIEDFLRDDDFIRYAIEGCTDNADRWEAYAQSPSCSVRNAYNKALHILQNLDDCTLLSHDEMMALKSRIYKTLKYRVN